MFKTVIDDAKELAKLAQEYGKVELYEKAVSQMGQIVLLQEENTRLKSDLAEAKELLKIKGALAFHENLYWRKVAEKWVGPHCSGCWDGDKVLVRTHNIGGHFPTCPRCKREIWTRCSHVRGLPTGLQPDEADGPTVDGQGDG